MTTASKKAKTEWQNHFCIISCENYDSLNVLPSTKALKSDLCSDLSMTHLQIVPGLTSLIYSLNVKVCIRLKCCKGYGKIFRVRTFLFYFDALFCVSWKRKGFQKTWLHNDIFFSGDGGGIFTKHSDMFLNLNTFSMLLVPLGQDTLTNLTVFWSIFKSLKRNTSLTLVPQADSATAA